ncbi:MAG: flagellar assembly protein FliX [Alphaproteobacteria bacterium]|nr:flagellar assembly protein FliX [Alphaproteobacteria bacterium]
MTIKIGSTGAAKAIGSTRKGTKATGADGSFSSFLEETEGVSSSSVGAASEIGGLEALLAAQSVGDALQDNGKKKRAAAHGNELLDKLEDLRTAILTGSVPKNKLIELAQALRVKREAGLDAELNQILDDIELRAEVELAKLSSNV